MQITQQFVWPTTNWPGTTLATQYTVFKIYPDSTPTVVQVVAGGATAVSLSYDDRANVAYGVRPSLGDGVGTPYTYGPEIAVFPVNYVPCRAWLRQQVRVALHDRTDSGSDLKWTDDELNGWINQGLTELNLLFPAEGLVTITLSPPTNGQGVRNYALPTDCYSVTAIDLFTANRSAQRRLSNKPLVNGEGTVSGLLGYPKLGIFTQPAHARFYAGHYDIYEGAIQLDWDPKGCGEFIEVRYDATRPYPAADGDLMAVAPEDMTLISLYTQVQAWLRIEGQDVNLSRWNDGKRDDMPTLKQSFFVKRLYDQAINDRRELRPRAYRLSRR